MKVSFTDGMGGMRQGILRSLLILFILSMGGSVLYLYTMRTKEPEPITIGAILSLTGPGSHIVDIRDAMQMAVDEVNSQGGVNGRMVELLVEDNRTDPKEAKRAFARLEEKSKPELYVSALSTIGMALKPLAEEHQVVLVGLNTTAPEFTEDTSFVFRYFFTAQEEARAAYNRLSAMHVRRIGILYLDDPYGNAVLKAFEKKFTNKKRFIRKIPFQVKDFDFTEQIQAVQDEPAIYLLGYSKHISLMIKQLRRAKYRGIILLPSGGSNPQVTTMDEAEGIYLAAPVVYNPVYPFAEKLKRSFEKRFVRKMSHQAANGYDFIKIITGLLEGEESTRANIKHLLEEGFMYSGVMGEQELKAGGQEINILLFPARIHKKEIMFNVE